MSKLWAESHISSDYKCLCAVPVLKCVKVQQFKCADGGFIFSHSNVFLWHTPWSQKHEKQKALCDMTVLELQRSFIVLCSFLNVSPHLFCGLVRL